MLQLRKNINRVYYCTNKMTDWLG
uniref:Uncharacterized protein n=1 Tax=Arundo donax TaxID=35708 RepID=A0A0A9BZU2_ARUDO